MWLFDEILAPMLATLSSAWRYPLTGLALASSYFAYGLTLLLVAPLLNLLLGGRLQPYRGSAVSLMALRWYVHCTLTLVVRYSFLEFVTPSPFAQLYYRLMGMKIGRNVTINSTAIADPSLIEMADGVTIGGSASVMAHYAQGGYLVIAPVRLGSGATIVVAMILAGVGGRKMARAASHTAFIPAPGGLVFRLRF